MHARYLSIILLLLFLLLPSYADEGQLKSGPVDPAIEELVRLVNAKRRSVGCPELRWDDRVAAVASAHSTDMVTKNFFKHTNPDGESPFERLRKSKVVSSAAAENIALGPRTGQEAYDIWLSSPGHRRNMLDCRFTRQGVGRTTNRWTHVLLTP